MTDKTYDAMAMGKRWIDLYSNDIGAAVPDVRSFTFSAEPEAFSAAASSPASAERLTRTPISQDGQFRRSDTDRRGAQEPVGR